MNGETTLAKAFRKVYLVNIVIVIILNVKDIIEHKGVSKDFGIVFGILLGIMSAINFAAGALTMPFLFTEKPIKEYSKALLIISGILFLFSFILYHMYPIKRQ